MKEKKRDRQQIISWLLLMVTLGIVLYIGLSGNDIVDLTNALSNLTPVYLVMCLVCWVLYVLFDALAVYHYLHMQGQKIKLYNCIHSSMTGIYYSNITPGATGGQPMEMYRLHGYGVPVGVSGSAMAVKFVFFQTVLLIFGTILWMLHIPFVSIHLQGKYWFVLLGYVANLFTIGLVALMSINRKAVLWVITHCISVGFRLHLCKEPDKSTKKWMDHCECFSESVHTLVKKPKHVLIQSLISLCQLLSLMGVVLLVYHALGLKGTANHELLTLGVLLYIGASYVPLPGASGAQEGGFAALFGGIFPDAQLFVALMLWRFCTYYVSVLVGAGMSVVENIRFNVRRSKV